MDLNGESSIFFIILCLLMYLLMREMLYEVRCLKSNEDMILALAGQFKQLSHEPKKNSGLCDFVAQLVRALHRHRRGHGFESR